MKEDTNSTIRMKKDESVYKENNEDGEVGVKVKGATGMRIKKEMRRVEKGKRKRMQRAKQVIIVFVFSFILLLFLYGFKFFFDYL